MTSGRSFGWHVDAYVTWALAQAGRDLLQRGAAVERNPSPSSVAVLAARARRLRDTAGFLAELPDAPADGSVPEQARRLLRLVRPLVAVDVARRELRSSGQGTGRRDAGSRIITLLGRRRREIAERLTWKMTKRLRRLDKALPATSEPSTSANDEVPTHMESRMRLAIDAALTERRSALRRLQRRKDHDPTDERLLKHATRTIVRWRAAEEATEAALDREEPVASAAKGPRLEALAGVVRDLTRATRMVDQLHLEDELLGCGPAVRAAVKRLLQSRHAAADAFFEALRTQPIPPAPHLRRWRKLINERR